MNERENDNVRESVNENMSVKERENGNGSANGRRREKRSEKGVKDRNAKRNGKRKENEKEGDTPLDLLFINTRGPRPTAARPNRISRRSTRPCPATCLLCRFIPECKCRPTCWIAHAWDYLRFTPADFTASLSILTETSFAGWTHFERVWTENRSF